MGIFIQHQGQQTGPFSAQQIQEGPASGLYQPTNLVWYEGMEGWFPLSTIPDLLSGTPPLPPGTPALPVGGQPENSGLAITSMILGISSILCGVTGIPAVICGHIAHEKIKQSQGRLTGSGFATTGLITGYLGMIILTIAFLAGLTAPMVIRQRIKANQTEATSNARSFGLALLEFESEYGSFPSASTAPLVAKDSNTPEITGASSNARFLQLFRAGITQSEQIFYAKSKGSHKPDGDISGNNALSPGECAFGYIENVSTEDAPRPLAMAPFKPCTSEFDPTPFDGKAVILWSDNAVRSLPINRTTGEAILDGQNLLVPPTPSGPAAHPHCSFPSDPPYRIDSSFRLVAYRIELDLAVHDTFSRQSRR